LGSLYILRGEKEDIVLEMVFKIRVFERSFSWKVALEIEVENMKVSCTLIPIMENG
jgi:hypothetical protein